MMRMISRMRTIEMQIGATIQTSSIPAGDFPTTIGSIPVGEDWTEKASEYGLDACF